MFISSIGGRRGPKLRTFIFSLFSILNTFHSKHIICEVGNDLKKIEDGGHNIYVSDVTH